MARLRNYSASNVIAQNLSALYNWQMWRPTAVMPTAIRERRHAPDLKKTKLCFELLEGCCRKCAACLVVHSYEDLSSLPAFTRPSNGCVTHVSVRSRLSRLCRLKCFAQQTSSHACRLPQQVSWKLRLRFLTWSSVSLWLRCRRGCFACPDFDLLHLVFSQDLASSCRTLGWPVGDGTCWVSVGDSRFYSVGSGQCGWSVRCHGTV